MYACCKRVEEASVRKAAKNVGIDRKWIREWSGKYDELKRHSCGAPCRKAPQSYHDCKRASVCGPQSTVLVLVRCAIDLHMQCYVLKASTRARVVGGQGAGLSTSPHCYAPPPPFSCKKGGVTAGQYSIIHVSVHLSVCYMLFLSMSCTHTCIHGTCSLWHTSVCD